MTDTKVDVLAELTSPIVARWLRSEGVTQAALDLARQQRSMDAGTYYALSNCPKGKWYNWVGRALLLGRGILTAEVIEEMVRTGYMAQSQAEQMIPIAQAIRNAALSQPSTRSLPRIQEITL